MINNFFCSKCQKNVIGVPLLKAVRSSFSQEELEKDKRLPKYNVMIKLICSQCGQYIKFLEQNEETINWANRVTENNFLAIYFLKKDW